ncbi:MAG: site-specific DNA-methyltransferase [Candidatus Symbiothrix sp.]|jgi:DNA modification methylase|nr:site-specific DNA-methyltransferase [Candidatus Symbiothrix sp.]
MINVIHTGEALCELKKLADKTCHCCVTSVPYFNLRDYGHKEQIGLEKTPEEYVQKLVAIFGEVKRVLRDDGTLWLNIGDSYNGSGKAKGDKTVQNRVQVSNRASHATNPTKIDGLKAKDLIGIPWMLAFALRNDGWYLRQDIIWQKPNPMPESVTDRCTKSHEYIFLLSKSNKYYFDSKAIAEPVENTKPNHDNQTQKTELRPQRYGGKKYTANPDVFCRTKSGNAYDYRPYRNKRSVWTCPTANFKDAHFAVYPEKLILPCIKAGCPEGGIVLDPFMGSGTTAVVARKLNRNYIGIELQPKNVEIANKRIRNELGLFE